ncbi:hypothetical protein [Hyphobacterium sp.]|uniref:hypothetical protein n=1 Tax=Hyphobacterium sp. TaxID=2004662 RepID=UPI003748D144
MKNLVLGLALFSLVLSPSALAGGGGGGSSHGSSSYTVNFDWNDTGDGAGTTHSSIMEELGVDDGDPRVISMPAIVVPLVSDHRLRGYAYVHPRLLVARGNQSRRVQENTHFALDRLIRASHRENLTDASGVTIDRERVREVWLEALAEYFGEGVIEQVSLATPDIRLIR